MERKKKIGVFVSGVPFTFQTVICKTIVEEAKRLGYQVIIYAMNSAFGNNILCEAGERNVVNLPPYDQFDGIIAAVDSLDIINMKEELQKCFGRCNCPVVYIRGEGNSFYNVLVENKGSIAAIVEHFVQAHHFRKICYLGGTKEMMDAQQRYESYLEVMERHSLPVTEHMVYHGNFWHTCSREAIDYFLSGGEEYPEAIVCANDFMALGVLHELHRRGIRVPEDICVSGVDDIEECMDDYPALTSVRIPFEEMAVRAVEIVDRVNHGEEPPKDSYVTGIPVARESCGCSKGDAYDRIRSLSKKNVRQYGITEQIYSMALEFEETLDEKDIYRVLARYVGNVIGMKCIYVCLCDEQEREIEEVEMYDKYTENMLLTAIMLPNGGLSMPNETFPRTETLPKQYMDEEDYLYVLPLHYKNHCFGYLALSMQENRTYDFFLQSWIQNLTHMLEGSYNNRKLKIVDEMRRLAMYDELTGLYNRRAFAQFSKNYFRKAEQRPTHVCIISIDMDGLKQINDTYGHAEGDAAIRSLSQSLSLSAENGEICCRIGGDEFAVCAIDYSQEMLEHFLETFRRNIRENNLTSGKPYEVDASLGYCIGMPKLETELASYIHTSDMNMYKDKKQRGRERVN